LNCHKKYGIISLAHGFVYKKEVIIMLDKNIAELSANREKAIVKTSIIGIVTNVFLAGFKAVIGIISNSIAITLDAVNNLSDAMSSVVTIIGAKLGAKLPNKKHPLGYGRI
jgi:divalent metal cation (Fe/Co/Zn/Cd) transporter